MYICNNSHGKITGNWKKDVCIAKAVRKINTKLGRKGRKVAESESVSLGRDSEEKGDRKMILALGSEHFKP